MDASSEKLRAKKALDDIPPYIPGKSVEDAQRETGLTRVIKLASNENPLGPSPLAMQAVLDAARTMHVYPDSTSSRLRKKLADDLGVHEDMILVSNGADDVLNLICQTFVEPGEKIIAGHPSFSSYEIFARTACGGFKSIPLRDWHYDLGAILEGIDANTRIVIICNPNNPTGTYIAWDRVKRFIEAVPKRVLVVLDEAYGEFVDERDAGMSIEGVKQGLNLVVVRTFSKVYGLAGVRVGYAIARADVISNMGKIKQAFSVSRLAEAAALAALDDGEHVEKTRKLVITGRGYLFRELTALGLDVVPSQANFLWVKTGMDSRLVFQELLRMGVIIRPGHIWGLPEYIRVSVGLPEENEIFVKSIRRLLCPGKI